MDWIDYGLGGLRAETLTLVQESDNLCDLYHELARRGELVGFAANQRFYEIGTPEALRETNAFLGSPE